MILINFYKKMTKYCFSLSLRKKLNYRGWKSWENIYKMEIFNQKLFELSFEPIQNLIFLEVEITT